MDHYLISQINHVNHAEVTNSHIVNLALRKTHAVYACMGIISQIIPVFHVKVNFSSANTVNS